ncbi:MAG: hypothetical protein LAT55_03215 [Opitutales bacterium]|nr:hypothetical protein [Opitutales bacterium]
MEETDGLNDPSLLWHRAEVAFFVEPVSSSKERKYAKRDSEVATIGRSKMCPGAKACGESQQADAPAVRQEAGAEDQHADNSASDGGKMINAEGSEHFRDSGDGILERLRLSRPKGTRLRRPSDTPCRAHHLRAAALRRQWRPRWQDHRAYRLRGGSPPSSGLQIG